MTRFRIYLATLLCKGTPCSVARTEKVAALHDLALDLAKYVDTSGGLQDPRRIRAYRTVSKGALGIATLALEVAVGSPLLQKEEERDASTQKAA